jgi:hypothetical protein
MEPIKVTLCPECGQCPCVEIDEKGVRIGEHENMVTLTHAECYTTQPTIRLEQNSTRYLETCSWRLAR